MARKVYVSLSLFILVVILSSLVDARLEINSSFSDNYNLGESIKSSVKIDGASAGYFILGSSINCGDFKIGFFKSARDIEANKTSEIILPEIPVNKKMIGLCYLYFSIEDFEGKIVENISSQVFKISDKIYLNLSSDKIDYLPGEVILVSGGTKKFGNYNLTLLLNGEKIINKSIYGKEFLEKIVINESFKGNLNILAFLIDSYYNFAYEEINISVISIPKRLSLSIVNDTILPGESVFIKGVIFDQAEDFIKGDLSGVITGPNNIVLKEFNVTSGVFYNFSTGWFSPPGKYSIEMKSGKLKDFLNFIVQEVRKVEVNVSGNKILFKNMGNVPYIQRGSVDAIFGDIVYKIPLSFDLKVGESNFIDLSTELSRENYNLSISGNYENIYFENKLIEDNRDIGKKVSQRVSILTGNTVIDTTSKKNFVFVSFFGLLILSALVYFVNNKLKLRKIHSFEDKVVVQDRHIGTLNRTIDVEREKSERIKKLFGQYVDTDVLEQHEQTKKMGTEKREITVMFSDIRGFSAMFSRLDDVKITEFLNPYFKRSHEIVNRYGGMVNKFIGDSVMALFNAPRIQPDHLLRAIRTAIETQREVEKLNTEMKKKGLDALRVGIGIDSGSAAVGHLGGEGKIEYTAIGVPVNIAARLQAAAEGGQILVRKEVYEKVKDRVEAEYMGKKQFKNISGDFDVYNIKGMRR